MTSNVTFNSDTTGAEVVQFFQKAIAGKTFVITGPSTGSVGGQTAIDLAAGKPKQLILAGRTRSKIAPVLEEIAKISPSTKAEFVELNLSDMKSVRAAAKQITSMTDEIDALINNAGIMALDKYNVNPDNVELQFATNHLGHFLLTNLLLPHLASHGRIVNLSSGAFGLSPARSDDPNWEDGKAYNPWLAYGSSKTANLLFTHQLARSSKLAEKNIFSFAVNPGLIIESHLQDHFDEGMFELGTETYKNVYKERKKDMPPMPAQKHMAAGDSTTLVAALDPVLEKLNGRFLGDCQFIELSNLEPYVFDDEQAQKLWTVSEKLVGQQFAL